jgi:hypothetical protein
MQHRTMWLTFITIGQRIIDKQHFIEIQSNSQYEFDSVVVAGVLVERNNIHVVGGTVLYPNDAIYNCYGDVLTFQGSVQMFILRFR